MHRRFLFFVCLIGVQTIFAQQKNTPPKLVVGIVVDQMRYDYIWKYWEKYSEGGFKRLINKGLNCENTHFNYVPTYTGPGHASIYAGAPPAIHGIISNDWYVREQHKNTYCAADASVSAVGGSPEAGKMSPANLLASNISDELRLATQNKGKVIGIALKDRGAIMPAGHAANAAYWFDVKGKSGEFMSSTFYIKELPEWVVRFNAQKKAHAYLSAPWKLLLPESAYTESGPDDTPYEAPFSTEKSPVFPHDLPALLEKVGPPIIAATPFGNSITKDFAIAAIQGEALGKDNVTDLLAVSFSSTDYVGHQFGTNSLEIEDTYLRFDRDLAELLTFLDTYVGKNEYTLFLTADHGAVPVPAYLKDNRIPSGLWDDDQLKQKLNTELVKILGDSVIEIIENQQIYLKDMPLTQKEVACRTLKELLFKEKGIAHVLTREELYANQFTQGVFYKIQNGFYPKRSGDICLIFDPGWLDHGEKGTSHGSAYTYDTHVPLLWMGKNIKPGVYSPQVEIIDIAPTLSQMLHIPFPNGCVGKPIPLR